MTLLARCRAWLHDQWNCLEFDDFDPSDIIADFQRTWGIDLTDPIFESRKVRTVGDVVDLVVSETGQPRADVSTQVIAIFADRLSRDATTIREDTRLSAY